MSGHKEAMALASASLMDLISRGRAIQAATVRGDSPAEIEKLRQEAHDVCDAYLDRMTDAATHVRTILEG